MSVLGRCLFDSGPHPKLEGWCEGWRPEADAAQPPTEVLCSECKQRPATCKVGKSGGAGKDMCEQCWREEWTSPSDDWQDER